MHRKSLSTISALALLVATCVPVRGYSLEYHDPSGIVARHWVARPIIIAFSTSLSSPPANIREGTDVIGAARRALQRWADAADVQFLEISSTVQTVSPPNAGDGISLVTISAENAALFGSSQSPGRTRVFYDSGGAIVEADIALNPNQLFSSDGTPGTYDIESTFAHEIGHFLGLEHSAVIGATMQPRQAKNGLYHLPAFSQRTLSDDDYAGARFLYGPRTGLCSISGKLMTSDFGRAQTVFGGHVFAEDVATGKILAGSITLANGDYHLVGLIPGAYRLIGQSLNGPVDARDIASNGSYSGLTETSPAFRTFVGAGSTLRPAIRLRADSAVDRSFFIFSNPGPALQPRVIGMNEELSTAALPLEAGKTFTIYVGGYGLDDLLANGISASSPFITVNPASLTKEEFGTPYPVISFEITVAADVPPGDYSLRLESNAGEVAYLPGAITIDPGINYSVLMF